MMISDVIVGHADACPYKETAMQIKEQCGGGNLQNAIDLNYEMVWGQPLRRGLFLRSRSCLPPNLPSNSSVCIDGLLKRGDTKQ